MGGELLSASRMKSCELTCLTLTCLTGIGCVLCPLLAVTPSVLIFGGLVVGSANIDMPLVSSGGGGKVSFERGANQFFFSVGTGCRCCVFCR